MLIYSAITSLDGYTTDPEGSIEWAAPDEEVHAFLNDQERGIGTYLYGRAMYEAMVYWETVPDEGQSPAARDYIGIWRSASKIVYSATLQAGPPPSRPGSARAFSSWTSAVSPAGPSTCAIAPRTRQRAPDRQWSSPPT